MRFSDRRALWWVPGVAWMALIFVMSGRAGSAENSGTMLAGWFGLSGYWLDVANGLLRKGVHVGEYAVLAVLLYLGLRRAHRVARGWALAGGLLLAMAYACSDEVHQLFVPGRQGQVIDWLTDSVGSLIGTLAVFQRRRARGKEVSNA